MEEVSQREEYIPTTEQEKRLEVLKQLVIELELAGIRYSIAGGYGLDGLYGELTRDHDDIDMLVYTTGMEKVRSLLSKLGFEFETERYSGVETYVHIPTSTKLEVGTSDFLGQYTNEEESIFLPENTNACLGGVSFRTPTLEGHEVIHDMQAKRAQEGKWGKYKHTETRNKLIKEIQNRQK